jgi:hypothetical protein
VTGLSKSTTFAFPGVKGFFLFAGSGFFKLGFEELNASRYSWYGPELGKRRSQPCAIAAYLFHTTTSPRTSQSVLGLVERLELF